MKPLSRATSILLTTLLLGSVASAIPEDEVLTALPSPHVVELGTTSDAGSWLVPAADEALFLPEAAEAMAVPAPAPELVAPGAGERPRPSESLWRASVVPEAALAGLAGVVVLGVLLARPRRDFSF